MRCISVEHVGLVVHLGRSPSAILPAADRDRRGYTGPGHPRPEGTHRRVRSTAAFAPRSEPARRARCAADGAQRHARGGAAAPQPAGAAARRSPGCGRTSTTRSSPGAETTTSSRRSPFGSPSTRRQRSKPHAGSSRARRPGVLATRPASSRSTAPTTGSPQSGTSRLETRRGAGARECASGSCSTTPRSSTRRQTACVGRRHGDPPRLPHATCPTWTSGATNGSSSPASPTMRSATS